MVALWGGGCGSAGGVRFRLARLGQLPLARPASRAPATAGAARGRGLSTVPGWRRDTGIERGAECPDSGGRGNCRTATRSRGRGGRGIFGGAADLAGSDSGDAARGGNAASHTGAGDAAAAGEL